MRTEDFRFPSREKMVADQAVAETRRFAYRTLRVARSGYEPENFSADHKPREANPASTSQLFLPAKNFMERRKI